VQDAVVEGFDFGQTFVGFDREDRLPGRDRFAVLLQPLDHGASFHCPAEPGHDDLVRHCRIPLYSATRSRMAWAIRLRSGTT
jgi:hypothetical protein